MTAKEALVEAYSKGYRVTEEGAVIGLKGSKLKTMISNKGYHFFHTRIAGRKCAIFVHRLMAYQKFGENLFKYDMVRHLDNNKENNTIGNISLGNWHDNYKDMTDEMIERMIGHSRKFSSEEVKEIRLSLIKGCSIRKLAEKYNVSPGTIQQIKERRSYRWVS